MPYISSTVTASLCRPVNSEMDSWHESSPHVHMCRVTHTVQVPVCRRCDRRCCHMTEGQSRASPVHARTDSPFVMAPTLNDEPDQRVKCHKKSRSQNLAFWGAHPCGLLWFEQRAQTKKGSHFQTPDFQHQFPCFNKKNVIFGWWLL